MQISHAKWLRVTFKQCPIDLSHRPVAQDPRSAAYLYLATRISYLCISRRACGYINISLCGYFFVTLYLWLTFISFLMFVTATAPALPPLISFYCHSNLYKIFLFLRVLLSGSFGSAYCKYIFPLFSISFHSFVTFPRRLPSACPAPLHMCVYIWVYLLLRLCAVWRACFCWIWLACVCCPLFGVWCWRGRYTGCWCCPRVVVAVAYWLLSSKRIAAVRLPMPSASPLCVFGPEWTEVHREKISKEVQSTISHERCWQRLKIVFVSLYINKCI